MANTQHFGQAIGNIPQAQKVVWASLVTDLGVLRTAIKAITAKLDLDSGVNGTDFASTCDPAALVTTT